MGDKRVAPILDPHFRRRRTNPRKGLVIGFSKHPWTGMNKCIGEVVDFHSKGHSLTVLPIFCYTIPISKCTSTPP